MNHTYISLGSLFLAAAGIIYGLERLSSYIYWHALVTDGSGYPTEPDTFLLFSNLFVPLFLVIAIIFYIFHFKGVNKDLS
ncbi:hypothetical protein [Jeotgalibacillus proteolyticus]|uniref:Uncharacterized protein n=1 Tax=Jeotgalibacillus proteolyticus TaxID=2082395 RepID=A0A2S5G8D7_9BACL|nr:hypothetical protein [Jeotgalibacillus proteolyticus]PPA69267.1 hypothetical protein C4B60_15805 [Jeotgalibacillus proteolyticus]